MQHALLAALVMVSLPAAAQVHKCVDAAGKVEYSTAPCPSSAKQSQQLLSPAATRAQPVDPYASQRVLESYERATAISRSINEGALAGGGGGGAGIIDSDPNQRIRAQDQRNMQRKMAEIEANRRAQEEREARAEIARERAARQPQFPKQLTQCAGAYCYDNTGGSYLRNGDGTLMKSGGGICRPVPGLAGQYNCQ